MNTRTRVAARLGGIPGYLPSTIRSSGCFRQREDHNNRCLCSSVWLAEEHLALHRSSSSSSSRSLRRSRSCHSHSSRSRGSAGASTSHRQFYDCCQYSDNKPTFTNEQNKKSKYGIVLATEMTPTMKIAALPSLVLNPTA